MRKYLLILSLFLASLAPAFGTGDSLNYLTPQDTIFLHLGNYGEKIFYHGMEKKQTLFSLAKFYGLELRDIYNYNPEIDKKIGVSVGSSVRIPIPNRAIIRYLTWENDMRYLVPVYYVVRKGDTMYSIAKTHFKMPVQDIMNRNGMLDENVSVGQLLHVGWMSLFGVPEDMRKGKGGPLWQKSHDLEKQFVEASYVKKEQKHQGVAIWNKDGSTGGAELFALHSTAPQGSIISITNPMTNRTVFAKVLGKVPSYHPDNTIAVISAPIAHLLGAIDSKFFVQISYLK